MVVPKCSHKTISHFSFCFLSQLHLSLNFFSSQWSVCSDEFFLYYSPSSSRQIKLPFLEAYHPFPSACFFLKIYTSLLKLLFFEVDFTHLWELLIIWRFLHMYETYILTNLCLVFPVLTSPLWSEIIQNPCGEVMVIPLYQGSTAVVIVVEFSE